MSERTVAEVVAAAIAADIDALRLPCPTCGSTHEVFGRDFVPKPCPDCTDGRMSHERAWKIVAAVFDDQPYDGDLPTEITYLRGIR